MSITPLPHRRFPRRARALAALLGGAALAAALALPAGAADDTAPAPAQNAAGAEGAAAEENPVLAVVDGREIRASDLAEELRNLPPAARQVPQAMLYDLVLDNVISSVLVAKAAEQAGLDQSDAYKEQMEVRRRNVLTQLYLQDVAEAAMSEDKVAAAYEAMKKEGAGRQQVRARHILVKDEAEAKRIIGELEGGMDFAAAAEQYSTGPSKTEGGDLGYFGEGEMVPEFSEAAFALEPGSYTKEPVQTQFGWHIIKLEDRREAAPPPLEEVLPQLQQQVVEDAIRAEIDSLKAAAKIEKKSLPAALGGAAPAKE